MNVQRPRRSGALLTTFHVEWFSRGADNGTTGRGGETDGFLGDSKATTAGQENPGCMRSKCAWGCFLALAIIGGIFVLLGIVVILMGEGLLEEKILESMALTPGSPAIDAGAPGCLPTDQRGVWRHGPCDIGAY